MLKGLGKLLGRQPNQSQNLPVDLAEVDRRLGALEHLWDDPEFLKRYAGKYISVEEGDGKYRIAAFASWKKCMKYIDRSSQRHCMPAPLYIQRANEIFMGSAGFVRTI